MVEEVTFTHLNIFMLGVLLENSRGIFGGKERRDWDLAFFSVSPFPWLTMLISISLSYFPCDLTFKKLKPP